MKLKKEYAESSVWLPPTEEKPQRHVHLNNATTEDLSVLVQSHPHLFETEKPGEQANTNTESNNAGSRKRAE